MTRLVVFDLDETLWSLPGGYCAQMTPPFRRDGDRVRDASGYQLTLRPDARSTLESLENKGSSFQLPADPHPRPPARY